MNSYQNKSNQNKNFIKKKPTHGEDEFSSDHGYAPN